METDEDSNLAEQRDTDIGKWSERGKNVRRTMSTGERKGSKSGT